MFPPGLDELYRRMLRRILSSRNSSILVQILALSTVAYRPLKIGEMMVLLDVDSTLLRSPDFIKELVGLCGSFLTIKDLRVELIHQSAKDFLLAEGAKSIFIHGQRPIQTQMYTQSLKKLHSALRRDIYSLKYPGIALSDVSRPSPDPLEDIEYSCVYWMDHFMEQYDDHSEACISWENVRSVYEFIKERFFYWLEALSLLGGISILASSISKLESRFTHHLLAWKSSLEPNQYDQLTQLQDLVQDGLQFVRYFHHSLESFPLQVYVSGLLFSPSRSILKHLFAHEMPKWIDVKRGLSKTWPAGITLGYKVQWPDSLQFSPKNDQIAGLTTIAYPAIRGWDVVTGRQTFNIPHPDGHRGLSWQWRFSFLENDKLVTSKGEYCDIQLWLLPRGQLQQTISLQIPEEFPWKAKTIESAPNGRFQYPWKDVECTFSRDATIFVRHTKYNSLEIYDTRSGTLKFHTEAKWNCQHSPVISADKLHVVTCCNEFHIWNIRTGCIVGTSGQSPDISRAIFSPIRNLVAIVGDDIQLWDWSQNCRMYSINEVLHDSPSYDRNRVAAFEPLTGRLTVSSPTALIEVDSQSGPLPRLLRRFRSDIRAITWSPNGRLIAVGDSIAIDVWDASSIPKEVLPAMASYSPHFTNLYLCGDFMVSVGDDVLAEIHIDSINGDAISNSIMYVNIPDDHHGISPNRCFAFFAQYNGDVHTWDLVGRVILTVFQVCPMSDGIWGITWDSQNKFITALTSACDWVTNWDARTGNKVKSWALPQLPEPWKRCELHWSSNNTYLIVLNWSSINVLNANSSIWQKLAAGDREGVLFDSMAFSPDETLFACANLNNGLRVWNMNAMELIMTVSSVEVPCSLVVNKQCVRANDAWYQIPTDLKLIQNPEGRHANNVNLGAGGSSSSVRNWVRFGGWNMIWIPGEYLPQTPSGDRRYWDIDGDRVAIGLTHDILVLDVSWNKWTAENDE